MKACETVGFQNINEYLKLPAIVFICQLRDQFLRCADCLTSRIQADFYLTCLVGSIERVISS